MEWNLFTTLAALVVLALIAAALWRATVNMVEGVVMFAIIGGLAYIAYRVMVPEEEKTQSEM